MRKPDFFIVGAPKCGTTALFRYLALHPEVFVPETKELNFFCTDLHAPSRSGKASVLNQADYLVHFAEWGREMRGGEASPWYMYSEQAAENIRAFSPAARIIIMIRNPVDMVYSMHSQLVNSGLENLLSFEDALAAAQDRREGRRLPMRDFDLDLGKLLQYQKIALFSDQILRYKQAFGTEQVLILLYDDFSRDLKNTYKQTLRFLGVDDVHQPDFQVVNANRTIRSRAVWRVASFRPPIMRRVIRAVLPDSYRMRLHGMIARVNTVERPRLPMKSDTLAYLQQLFTPEVARLSELLGRDLMPWVEPGRSHLSTISEARV